METAFTKPTERSAFRELHFPDNILTRKHTLVLLQLVVVQHLLDII